MTEKHENVGETKLAALRREIAAGLDSGPFVPLDMEEVKAAARNHRGARENVA